jgi:peroxiredoxin Q/BCP
VGPNCLDFRAPDVLSTSGARSHGLASLFLQAFKPIESVERKAHMPAELMVGDAAPNFSLRRDGSGQVTLADFKGRTLVLYFYPKADTPGCTREAQAFSALQKEFNEAGAAILGVSGDPVQALDKFRQKYELAIPLASDENHAMLEHYGVWGEKSLYGRKYMGTERATFLIAADGRIARIWRKVKVEGHVEEVLAAARALPRG